MNGKKLIVMCNSELDGFNEGDGDLMQRLVSEFNEDANYTAKRVVYRRSQVPNSLLNSPGLDILSDTEESNKDDFSAQLFNVLQSYNDYQKKIFYIGSRLDTAELSPSGELYLSGSGSFFTKDIILKLQGMNFKVVVCCLEFKFFRRSAKFLMHAAVMLKEQLFYADAIQFMNELDRVDFNDLIQRFSYSNMLEPIDNDHKRDLEYKNNLKYFDFTESIELTGGRANLGRMINKGRHIPGIYTVAPLSLELSTNDLLNRPNNLLCFGIIRGNKGIKEAIGIAKELEKRKDPRKVFIVGKVVRSLSLFKDMIKDVYDISLTKLSQRAFEILNRYTINKPIEKLKTYDGLMIFPEVGESIFERGEQDFILYCEDLLKDVHNRFQEQKKLDNVVILLNLPPDAMKDIGMICQYAIKLDHKGMADNASAIVSCLGMFLPTFTTCGLVTDNCFRDKEIHKIIHSTGNHQFSEVVIMPPEQYYTIRGEMRPTNFTPEEVCDILQAETAAIYRKRIEKLFELRESKVYELEDVKSKLDALINDLFPAAVAEEMPSVPVSII